MGFPRSRDRLSCLPDCVIQAGFLQNPAPMTNPAKTCTRTLRGVYPAKRGSGQARASARNLNPAP